jgi:hypothetical protein
MISYFRLKQIRNYRLYRNGVNLGFHFLKEEVGRDKHTGRGKYTCEQASYKPGLTATSLYG